MGGGGGVGEKSRRRRVWFGGCVGYGRGGRGGGEDGLSSRRRLSGVGGARDTRGGRGLPLQLPFPVSQGGARFVCGLAYLQQEPVEGGGAHTRGFGKSEGLRFPSAWVFHRGWNLTTRST